jgi:hypothetical protein
MSLEDRTQLLQLMQKHYEGIRSCDFERDLAEKQWAITLRKPNGEICGFSTQVLLPMPGDSKTLVLYSGDTVVEARYRHSNSLAGLWGNLVLTQIEAHPQHELVWFLISKGYKTYRYLPLFFREYYPHYITPTPISIASMIDKLGHWKFGQRYDAERKIIRAEQDGCRLKPEVAPINDRRIKNKDVQFFSQANPGHVLGDELCCLAELKRANFTHAAYRVIQAAMKPESV